MLFLTFQVLSAAFPDQERRERRPTLAARAHISRKLLYLSFVAPCPRSSAPTQHEGHAARNAQQFQPHQS